MLSVRVAILLVLAAACVRPTAAPVHPPRVAAPSPPAEEPESLEGLEACVAAALERSPVIREAFERWRADAAAVSGYAAPPEPELSFAYFLRSVETRVGPQRARVGLRQTLPWPSSLSHAKTSDAEGAHSSARALDAEALRLRQRVAEHYWGLWKTRRAQVLYDAQAELLEGLSATILARLEIGQATLAERQHVELEIARLRDATESLEARSRTELAALRSAIGLEQPVAIATPDGPQERPKLPPAAALEALAADHPSIQQSLALARSERARAERGRTERWPKLTLAVDWIVTGDAEGPMPDSGKDAVIGGVGLSLPVWQHTYADRVEQAEARARMHRARADATRLDLRAALAEARNRALDSARRIALYRHTLVPRAQTVLDSVLGAHATGRAQIAQALLAQQTLLQLRLELDATLAEHAQALATLESLVGEPIGGSA